MVVHGEGTRASPLLDLSCSACIARRPARQLTHLVVGAGVVPPEAHQNRVTARGFNHLGNRIPRVAQLLDIDSSGPLLRHCSHGHGAPAGA